MTLPKRESAIKTIRLQPSQFSALEGDTTCDDCGNDERLGFLFSYAYQPIVDTATRQVYAHEALVGVTEQEAEPLVVAAVVTGDIAFKRGELGGLQAYGFNGALPLV